MNVYGKLTKARVLLQAKTLNKSGLNAYAKFTYFELKDFLPEVNTIFENLKLCSTLSFYADYVVLKIINAEKPEEVVDFQSPVVQATLKGTQEIQNLGATHTYMRRYMYMIALELCENDLVDSQAQQTQHAPQPPREQQARQAPPPPKPQQVQQQAKTAQFYYDHFMKKAGETKTADELEEMWKKANLLFKTDVVLHANATDYYQDLLLKFKEQA